jgi:hypothetical protein
MITEADFRQVVRFVSQTRYDGGLTVIGDFPPFYKKSENDGKTTIASWVHMRLGQLGIDKKDRYPYLADLVNHEVKSVKDLTIGEAIAFLNITRTETTHG